MADAGSIFLRQDFLTGKRTQVHVELKRSGVFIRREGKRGTEVRLVYPFADVLGAVRVDPDELEILSCPFVNKSLMRKAGRRLDILKLRVDGVESAEERLSIVNAFRLAICRGSRGLDVAGTEQPPARKCLVYVNPFSGTKQAEKIFRSQVQPMYAAAGVEMDLVTSTSRGFVQEHAKSVDFSDKHSIVVVSGDGVMTEALNGIMARPDWKSVLRVPFAVIPAGSGNALASSVLHASKENYGVTEAVYVALKGSAVPLDMMSVSSSKRRIYSALSVTWGLLADIDIGSEKFRRLGSARFTMSFMQNLTALKKYPAKLSFLPGDGVDGEGSPGDDTEAMDDLSLGLAAPPVATRPPPSARRSLRKRVSSNHSVTTPPAAAASDENTAPPSSFTLPKSVHLPDLSDAPPSSWVTAEGPFVTVFGLMPSHLGWDMHMQHHARLSDGLIHVTYVGGASTRASLLSVFTQLGDGTGSISAMSRHPSHDVHHHAVKAFRLEMDPAASYLAIDGENVENGSIQCEVLPRYLRIIAMLPDNYGDGTADGGDRNGADADATAGNAAGDSLPAASAVDAVEKAHADHMAAAGPADASSGGGDGSEGSETPADRPASAAVEVDV